MERVSDLSRVGTKKIILEMSDKVVENLAQKYENVREGVMSVLGEKVLEHEAKRILNEGKLCRKRESQIVM